MSVIVIPNPSVRIDIMVRKEFLPIVSSRIDECHCFIEKQIDVPDMGNGEEWVKLIDLQAHQKRLLGECLGALHTADFVIFSQEKKDEKLYILMQPRKKEGYDVRKDRKKAGAGSKGGNSGKSARNSGT